MSTFYSDSHADLDLDATGATPVQAGDYPNGDIFQRRERNAIARYTMKGTEAQGDVVRLFKLKKGTTIIPQRSFTQNAAVGATATIDIGDLDTLAPTPLVDSDADRYADGLNVAAAGTDAFAAGVATTALYTLQEDCWITMTFATLVTPVEDGTIDVVVAYLEPQ